MEGKIETALTVNEEPGVELVEGNELVAENGEPIPAELFAESDEPAEPEVSQTLSPKIVPDEPDLQPILELDADPRAQLQANYGSVAAGDVALSLKAAIAAGLCAFVHHCITQREIEQIPLSASIILSLIVFRFWYVRRGANRLAKTKIVLTEDHLLATGPHVCDNWKIRLSSLNKATLISETQKSKTLVLSTSTCTRVLRGLEDPEKLLLSLPKEIQVDTSAMGQKLQEFADSMFDCKDADEVEALRDAKQLQARAQDSLSEEFPEARVLKQDFSHIANDSKLTLVILGVILIFAYLGYPQIALPLLPIAIFAYLPGLLSLRKTLDCLYVFSDNALYELDRKLGTVHTISLNRIINRKDDSEDDLSLYIDNAVHLPARIEKADADYIKRCLKEFPNSASL